MKKIKTNLTENQFTERLKSLTVPHDNFERGYENKNIYTLKTKKKGFRIGYHVEKVWNTSGYLYEFLYGKYSIDNDRKIVVKYFFAKPIAILLPFLIFTLLSLPIFGCLLYDAIFNHYIQLGGTIVTGILSLVGLFGVLHSSRKTQKQLENHLLKICKLLD